MKSLRMAGLLLLLTGLFSTGCQAFCFDAAGARYHIDPRLLRAIAIHESHMNAHAIGLNKSKNGLILSADYGVMQINSGHLPELKQLGILQSKDELLTNPCLNVQIGAWVLARAFHSCGVNWPCLGAYNAADPAIRLRYAREIWAIYRKLLQPGATG